MANLSKLAFNTGSSVMVVNCQVCRSKKLISILFLGYLPPVNLMAKIGARAYEQPSYPAQWLYCSRCNLVQLGTIVDPKILFPFDYPYTSSTTRVLRENFAELYRESTNLINLNPRDLVIDIGSNDGNLLSNFKDNYKVLGITPERIGKIAIKKGINTIIDYFSDEVVNMIINNKGKAKIITATNVFAHMEDINSVIKNIKKLLTHDGVFISESHYLYSLIKTLQYDTIYHEHMRYYSLHSLKFLLEMHGLVVFHAKKIPSHGGSIRVYCAKPNIYPIKKTVAKILKLEKSTVVGKKAFLNFKKRVVFSKLALYTLVHNIKKRGKKIYGVGAPSRASTLINYVGLDDGIIDYVVEIKGSYKIGKYIPGTLIPVIEESSLYRDQPDYALLLSWHISKELIEKLTTNGYKGRYIIPLPKPTII